MYLASIYPRILHTHVPHLVPLMVAAARVEGAALRWPCNPLHVSGACRCGKGFSRAVANAHHALRCSLD